LITSELFFFVD